MGRGTDRISFASFPLLFENPDIKIAYRFATFVEYPELRVSYCSIAPVEQS